GRSGSGAASGWPSSSAAASSPAASSGSASALPEARLPEQVERPLRGPLGMDRRTPSAVAVGFRRVSDERYVELKGRLAELWDLVKLAYLAGWDQQTMMPAGGAAVRAEQRATMSKLMHDRLVAEDLGELLEELRPYEESLDFDSDEASLIRVARRDRDKELKVPAELREEQSRASAEAFQVWVEARSKSDF